MSQFNLIDEKWIPVRFSDGTRDELGIRDTLLRAKEIAAIEDQSPLVVAALHRFLLAVLYRALEGPTDIEQAKELFENGLPHEKITAYLEKWRNRFWLFDEKYPFGQNPNVPRDEIEPWTKLTAEYNATSNKVLFDHTNTIEPGSREPKECARWLLSTMNFSISGGRGYYPSPSPNAMMCIPLGRDLYHTLCYNLVPYANRDAMQGDSALWEREPKTVPLDVQKQCATGYAGLYSWQARMVFLEKIGSGNVIVARFIAGQGFENTSNSLDPMQPYKADKERGKLPVQFREDRGTWRDFDSLLPYNTDPKTNLAPQTIQHALRLAGQHVGSRPPSILVLGLKYSPPSANVDFWRMERFALPEVLADDHFIRQEIRQLLSDAEDTQNSLWKASSSFARNLLSRGDRNPTKKEIRDFVKPLPGISWYWSTLESSFHEILCQYSLEDDFDDIRQKWLACVRDALKQAWEQYHVAVSTSDAWAIRALVKSEGPIRAKLRELNNEIRNFES